MNVTPWLLATALVAVPVLHAQPLPDGDFASGVVQPAGNDNRVADRESHVDTGFYYGAWNPGAWTVASGRVVRDFTISGGTSRGIASIWSATNTAGDYALQFDYEWDSTDEDGVIMVELYSYRDLGPGADSINGLVYADRMEVGNSDTFTPSNGGASNFEKTQLASIDIFPRGVTNDTYQLAFTLDEDLLPPGGDLTYGDRLLVRIYALNLGGDTAGVLAFDNFAVVAAGAPPPVLPTLQGLGMVAGGGLVLTWTPADSGSIQRLYWSDSLFNQPIDHVLLADNLPLAANSYTDTVQVAETHGFYWIETAP